MWYELWDRETGNRVGRFNTREEALRAVAGDVDRYGRDSTAILSLGLLHHDPKKDHLKVVAEGTKLVNLALAAANQSSPSGKLASADKPKQIRR